MQIFTVEPHAIRNRPILVNENMEVIDGQHRLEALRKLGYPVYYQIGEGLGLKETIEMNAVQKHWNPLDYANSYAASGLESYQRYLQFHEQFGTLPHSTIIHYMLGAETARMGWAFRSWILPYSSTINA